MSSDSERSSVEQSDSEETDPEEKIENDDVDEEVVLSLVQPYEDEPLADASAEPDMEENEDADADGLTPTVLEARYERTVPVTSWFVWPFQNKLYCAFLSCQFMFWRSPSFMFTFFPLPSQVPM